MHLMITAASGILVSSSRFIRLFVSVAIVLAGISISSISRRKHLQNYRRRCWLLRLQRHVLERSRRALGRKRLFRDQLYHALR